MSGASTFTYNGSGPFASQTNVGSIAQWIAFAFCLGATVFFLALSYVRNVRPEARLTYYLVTLICAITASAYLVAALGGLYVPGQVAYAMTSTNSVLLAMAGTSQQLTYNLIRSFSWLRWASYAAVAPLTIVILGILAGAHWTEFIWVSVSAMLSVAGLYASIISTAPQSQWPIFSFAIFAGVPVGVALVYTFRVAAHKVHPEIGRLYDVVGFGSFILYAGYAITAGVSEVGFITSVDQECIIYAALDILTKVVFGFVLIWSREAIARYGTFLGQINTGVDFDFPIQRSTYTGSGSNYATEPTPGVVLGEHRDLAFAQLHAATNTTATQGKELAYNPWP